MIGNSQSHWITLSVIGIEASLVVKSKPILSLSAVWLANKLCANEERWEFIRRSWFSKLIKLIFHVLYQELAKTPGCPRTKDRQVRAQSDNRESRPIFIANVYQWLGTSDQSQKLMFIAFHLLSNATFFSQHRVFCYIVWPISLWTIASWLFSVHLWKLASH